jgi:hypothetical protein
MVQYSSYFKTIYDEQSPSTDLGRGTHYSIFRTVVWKDFDNNDLKKPKHLDFAVLWDEDHDTRVIRLLDKIYTDGYIHTGLIFGERKGCFSLKPSKFRYYENEEIENIYLKIKELAEDLDGPHEDQWTFYEDDPPYAIIHGHDKDVSKYLTSIKKRWKLGLKAIK